MAAIHDEVAPNFNPLLSNPPPVSRESIAAADVASVAVLNTANGAVAATAAAVNAVTTTAAMTATAALEATTSPSPVKKGWTALAARPQNQPKKNTSQMATAAKAARMLNSQQQFRLQGSPSSSSFTLSEFPMPGKAMAAAVRPGMLRSTSYNRDDKSKAGAASDSDNNSLKANSLRGLGIHPSRSMAQLSNVNSPNRSMNMIRRMSNGSSGSAARSQTCNSLGDGVGFTFKGTTNFVHPNRQVPRTFNVRSQNASAMSLNYEDEEDDVMVERMNSVTSDGGWKAGWSVGSGSGSVSGPSRNAEGEHIAAGDLAPDDVDRTIMEESEGERSPGPRTTTFRAVSPFRSASPARTISPCRVPTSTDETSSTSSSRTGRSIISRKSSLSQILRSRSKDGESPSWATQTSPIRDSIDKAVGRFSRTTEPESSASRSASIALARLAFEEKEAMKDRKHAEKEARREVKRRASDAHGWKRHPSNAVDSAWDSAENSPTYAHARSGSIARSGSVPRNGSMARSNSFAFGSFANVLGGAGSGGSRSATPDQSNSDSDSCDPLSRVPEQDSVPESNAFPQYQEEQAAVAPQAPAANHSMFSSAWQEEMPQHNTNQNQQLEQWEQEGALFPPMRTTPLEEISSAGALFPAPSPVTPLNGPAVYNIDGKMYDEYGMPVHQVILPSARRAQEDGGEKGGFSRRERRPSMTKQAKGKLNKFSAWSKTRLLRV